MDESPTPGAPGPLPSGIRSDPPRAWLERLTRFAETTDGTSAHDGLGTVEPVDRVAAFGPAILAIRWATTIVSLGLAIQRTDGGAEIVAWCVILVLYTVLRTVQPIRYLGTNRSLIEVLGEVALGVAAVCTTGGWDSPFIFSLMTAVIVAGFSRGFGFALRVAIVSAFTVTFTYLPVSYTHLTLPTIYSV